MWHLTSEQDATSEKWVFSSLMIKMVEETGQIQAAQSMEEIYLSHLGKIKAVFCPQII